MGRLEKIKTEYEECKTDGSACDWISHDDFEWLISEIERLRKEQYNQAKKGFNISVLSESLMETQSKKIKELEKELEHYRRA